MAAQADNNNDIYASILSIAKEGASKKEIAQALSMSYQQLRRLSAELVDRGMLGMFFSKIGKLEMSELVLEKKVL
jgi:predicted transcriptional regulator